MIWNRKSKATQKPTTGPVVIPDDVQQARELGTRADEQKSATQATTEQQKTWFERAIAPGLEELRIRREQNNFGRDFELSFAPRDRG